MTLSNPVVLQGAINIGVNIMDTVMLANYGEIQLSAASLATEYINLFQILCMGMGCGAAVLTAQYWGRGDHRSLSRTITVMLRICLGIATAFLLLTWLAPGQILHIYTADEAVIEKGILYLNYSIFTFPLMGLTLTLTQVLRSIRDVRVPLIASIVAFGANIFFNWVFIFGKLGAPEMQIAGAALGTLLARIVETIIIVGYVFGLEKTIHFRFRNLFDRCGDLIPKYLQYSLPVIVSDCLLSLGNNAVAVIMGHIGANFVAANSIVMVTVRLSTVFNQGLSNASSVLTGNTLGKGDKETAYRQGATFIGLSFIIGLLAAGIIQGLSGWIISCYNVSEETAEIARQLMNAISIMVIFQTSQSVLTKGILRGGGDTHFLVIADIFFLWMVSVPLGAAAGLVWGWTPFWIYVCLKVEYPLKTVLCLIRFRSKKWIKIV
ncbi:MAG: MATE family efflux transporter [Lachnospiraceae bacterium]|nr:MATE family efflux transporter [Lachnospiraceae bacterium]